MGELVLFFLFPVIIGFIMINQNYKKIGLVYLLLSLILLLIGCILAYYPKEYGSLGIALGPIVAILSFVGLIIVLFKYINESKDGSSQVNNNFHNAKEEYLKSYKERFKN